MSVSGVFLVRIQCECGKIWARKTPNTDTFHAVILVTDGILEHIFLTKDQRHI